MTTSNYIHLNDIKFVSITGEDKKEFLQGIITNDINKCDDNQAIYSCLLSPQGKFLSDFFIIPFQGNYLIEINKLFFDSFISRLNIYKLRSKVEIHEIKNYTSLVILKNKRNKSIQYNNLITFDNYIKFDDPRNNFLGQKIFIKSNKKDNFIKKNNLKKIDKHIYREILIYHLIPYSTEDLVVNKSLLLENNFDKINAIDWKKGCYVGQEITARMKYRAILKKSIRAFKIISGTVSNKDEIFLENKKIGGIISIIKSLGLAMIRIEDANVAKKNNNTLLTSMGKIKIIN